MVADSPRRFWQLHLSTALLLMLFSGGFLWLNLVPVERDEMLDDQTVLTMERGFPMRFQQRVVQAGQLREAFGTAALVFNVAVGIVALVWIAVVCEWMIRRKSASNAR